MVQSWRGWVVTGLLAGLVGLLPCPGVSAQQLTQQQVDALAARGFHSFELQRGDRNLHRSTIRFRDGAKGIGIYKPIGLPTENHWPYASKADEYLHGWYCRAGAVVLGKDMASRSYLSSDKSLILTGTRFLVDDVLKSGAGIAVNEAITVVRPGGEVRDQGELLRVELDRPGFQSGLEYVLFLTPGSARYPAVFRANPWITTEVVNGTVHASSDWALGVPDGQSYTVLRGRLDSLAAAFPCAAH
jgi:hypothetical protein